MSDLTVTERLENLRDKLYQGDTQSPHTYMQRLGNELNEIINDLQEILNQLESVKQRQKE